MTIQRRCLPGITAMVVTALAVPADDAWAQRGRQKQGGDYNNPICDVTVLGANSASLDADAINLAVNGPGAFETWTVCLQGTFDFGHDLEPQRFVTIAPDPEVQDLRITGIDGATIWFGIQPLRTAPANELASLTIDHIRFVQPEFTAISIFGGNPDGRVQISDNVIEGVRTNEFTALGPLFLLREGIVISTAATEIYGEFVIANNWIDAGTYSASDFDPNAFGYVNAGIGAFGRVLTNFELNAEVVVSGNTLIGWAGSGINVIQNDGESLIEHNLVVPGGTASASNAPNTCVANGIALTGTSNAVVRQNTIDVIPATTTDQTVPDCTAGILIEPSFAGTGAGSSDNLIRNNQIRGEGQYGIAVRGVDGLESANNTFIANQLANFLASKADVWLTPFANYNTFKGNHGTVDDNGIENTFTGPGGP